MYCLIAPGVAPLPVALRAASVQVKRPRQSHALTQKSLRQAERRRQMRRQKRRRHLLTELARLSDEDRNDDSANLTHLLEIEAEASEGCPSTEVGSDWIPGSDHATSTSPVSSDSSDCMQVEAQAAELCFWRSSTQQKLVDAARLATRCTARQRRQQKQTERVAMRKVAQERQAIAEADDRRSLSTLAIARAMLRQMIERASSTTSPCQARPLMRPKT